MLNFRQFILLEDRLDYLKSIHKNIDTSHDSLAKHHEPNDIINHFAQNADPSQNKQHTQWILKQYKNKSIRQEDHPRINTALSLFQKHQSKLPRKDLNQYRSLNDLEDSLEPYKETISNKEQKKLDKSGAEKIHDENGFKVYHLKTKEAACHYGKGTKWCTAADKNNMFHNYNDRGPIYYIEGKNNKGERKKYQFHFNSKQFMDDKDSDIDMNEFIKNNPEIKNVKEFEDLYPSLPLTPEGYKYHINKLNNGEYNSDDIKRAIKNGYLSPEHIDNIIKNPNSTQAHDNLVVGHGKKQLRLSPEQISNITKNPNSVNAHGRLVTVHRFKQLQLTPEQISNIIKNFNSVDAHWNLINSHRNKELQLTPEQINNIINNPNSVDSHWILVDGHRNKELQLTPEHIDNIIKNPNSTQAHNRLVDGHKKKELQLTPNQINDLTKMGHEFK